jgi:sigma-B regulation protein RsbU (phosphoserine phosphatase)
MQLSSMSSGSNRDSGTLQERVRQVTLLQDAAHKINSMLDLDELLDAIVGDVAQTFGCSRSAVLLKDDEANEVELVAVRGWDDVHPKGFRFRIGRDGMVGHVAQTGETMYAPNVFENPYYSVSEKTTRTELDIPLKIRGRVIGVFNAQHSEVNAFSKSQRDLLEALAADIAIAIENARLFRQERSARERLEYEQSEARRVQIALLPGAVCERNGFSVQGTCLPIGAVGGDWYDYFPLDNRRVGIVLGDVAGKGMPAALLMAATRSSLRQQAKRETRPAEVMSRLNDILREDFPQGSYVTMIYAVLDVENGTLTFSNAGHPWPLVATGREAEFLETSMGLPLGIRSCAFDERVVDLTAAPAVLFYSDGLIEAPDSQGEDFGTSRLRETFLADAITPEGLIESVRAFAFPNPLIDDATALLIRAT